MLSDVISTHALDSDGAKIYGDIRNNFSPITLVIYKIKNYLKNTPDSNHFRTFAPLHYHLRIIALNGVNNPIEAPQT